MSDLIYALEARGPLAINERKPGGSQYQEGLDYVPGRVVRGAVARSVLRTCRDPLHEQNHEACPTPELCRALFGDHLIFRDARPLMVGADVHLLPATAVGCKDEAGFLGDGRHGFFDTLIDRFCWETLRPAALQYLPRCPICGGRTKAAQGVYSMHATDPDGVHACHRHRVGHEMLLRVAINRRRSVAEDELLYAVNAISAFSRNPAADRRSGEPLVPTRFVGSIYLPDDGLHAAVEAALLDIHHVGSGAGRGLGRVEARVVPPPVRPSLAERLAAWNQKLMQRQAIVAGLPGAAPAGDAHYFSVTLQSDAILRAEDGWSPGVQLDAAALWRAVGERSAPPGALRLVRSYAATTTRGGWNAIWGLRKETALATQAGSVYLYQVDDLDGWVERLERLEALGVGDRRAEGFGQVRICDEFHYTAVEKPL